MYLLCNMDDYSVASLAESKNEWCARLVNIMTPALVTGLKSIFEEATSLCRENNEEDKYLMTFQTFLTRIPKWNNTIIETERERICEASSCSYLEDLVTCVHIIHLKALTCIRVGQEQKKIDIDVPSIDKFVHRVYIAVARKVYINVYLFEKDIPPLDIQKHNRELECIIKECILNTVRDSMPVEDILKAYISVTEEEEEVKQPDIKQPDIKQPDIKQPDIKQPDIKQPDVKQPEEPVNNPLPNNNEVFLVPEKLSFSDIDNAMDIAGNTSVIDAPKTDDRLEQIAKETAKRRKEEENEEENEDKLTIGPTVSLEPLDINDLNKSIDLRPPPEIHIDTLP